MSATQTHLFVPLLVATCVAAGLWLALVALWIVVTRPGHVHPGTPIMPDLEHEATSPAVVNLLVNHWRVENESVAATLVDLAARGYVSIEQTEPSQYQCRVKESAPKGDLLTYERQVLERVDERASDGTVPLAALESRPDEAEGWRKRFFAEVVADARSRGLSRPRLTAAARTLLTVTALIPAALGFWAITAAPMQGRSSSTSNRTNHISGIVIFAITFGVLFLLPRLSRLSRIFRSERSTQNGIDSAECWLGFREYLRRDRVFPTLPPAAVTIWGRNLSYGIALGAAAGTARALPFGIESDRDVWSSFTGQWRIVRVRYPKFFLWGRPPWRAVIRGLFSIVLAVLVVYGFEFVRRHSSQVTDHRISEGLAIAGVVLFAVVVPSLVLFGALVLWFGIQDAFAATDIEGRVLRLRSYQRRTNNRTDQFRHYLAVDDGSTDRIRAFDVDRQTFGRLSEGVSVRIRVTHHLGHVSAIALVGGGADPSLVPILGEPPWDGIPQLRE